ncbi:MAG: glycoside hydrolase [Planctomycetes bacterium]|nr:glycoside hydrolase [Planctomycetota bacterium]
MKSVFTLIFLTSVFTAYAEAELRISPEIFVSDFGEASRTCGAPHASSDGRGNIVVAFGAGPRNQTRLFVSENIDGEESFSAPSLAFTQPIIAMGVRGPKVAILSNGGLVVSVFMKTEEDDKYHLVCLRREKGSSEWTRVRITDSGAREDEGMHDMAVADDGKVFVVWQEGRNSGMQPYLSISEDGGATFGENRPVYASPSGSTCECCTPVISVSPDGTRVAVQFRNRIQRGNEFIRDIFVARSTDGGETFVAGSAGIQNWVSPICPMDSGMTSFSSDGLVSVYRSNFSGRERLYFSSLGAEGFGDPVELALSGNQGAFQPRLAKLSDDRYLAVWQRGSQVRGQPSRVEYGVIDPRGKLFTYPSGDVETESQGFTQIVSTGENRAIVVYEGKRARSEPQIVARTIRLMP